MPPRSVCPPWLAVAGTLVILAAAAAAELPPRHVILIVVDGLDARDVEEMPDLARRWRADPHCPRGEVRAPMPARTNVAHATLLTGVHPEIHGVTGNAFWDRQAPGPRKLGAAPDLLTETLFTVAGRTRPELGTAVVVGKGKLAVMFASSPQQRGPGRTWGPQHALRDEVDPASGYAYDAATLAGLRSVLQERPSGFVLVNLSDVDRVSHATGPHSPAARSTRAATDAALKQLFDDLERRPDWPATIVVITADHGFDTVLHQPVRFADVLAAEPVAGLVSVGDGGVGHVYDREPASAMGTARLAAARRLALRTDWIAEALYLQPNGNDGGSRHTIASTHPEWHLSHERTGDLLLVGRPGYLIVDGGDEKVRLLGSHGAPAETRVPLIVARGDGRPVDRPCGDVSSADVGRTLVRCLGLRDVERLDGSPIPDISRGRVLSGLCS